MGVCVCSLRYPAFNAHAHFPVACPGLQYFFPHYLISGTISEKKNIEYKMCVLIFSTTCF